LKPLKLPRLAWKFQNSSEHNSTCQRIIFRVGFGKFVDLLSVERASAWLFSQPVSLSITLLNGGLNLSCLNATSRSYFPRTQPGHWQTYSKSISTYLQNQSWNNLRSSSRKILHPFRLRHQAQTDTKYSRKGTHSPQSRRHVPHKRKNDDSCYGYQ
jgi:hypothetical protein